MSDLPFAEDCPYWKSGSSSPEVWVQKIIGLIEGFGGEVVSHAFGMQTGKAAYMFEFRYEAEMYKILWPVLASRSGEHLAEQRQAITAIYHDVKAKINAAHTLGARTAFFSHLLIEGRPLSQIANHEIARSLPQLLTHNE